MSRLHLCDQNPSLCTVVARAHSGCHLSARFVPVMHLFFFFPFIAHPTKTYFFHKVWSFRFDPSQSSYNISASFFFPFPEKLVIFSLCSSCHILPPFDFVTQSFIEYRYASQLSFIKTTETNGTEIAQLLCIVWMCAYIWPVYILRVPLLPITWVRKSRKSHPTTRLVNYHSDMNHGC